MKQIDYRINNLNLIRLFAAFQVIITHLQWNYPMPEWIKYISLFNGVPIFFTLSGYLIYWSYDNNPDIRTYTVNRILRIYPALICALVIAITLLFTFKVLTPDKVVNSSFLLWICTQLTFIQEFTPEILKGLADKGTPNAPLWTISVEMLLYAFIPLLFKCIYRLSRERKAFIILLFGIISYTQNQTGFLTNLLSQISDNGYYLIFIHPFMQFSSFFWFFSIGILIYLYRECIVSNLIGKSYYLLSTYIVFCVILYINNYEPGGYSPHSWELIAYLLLTACIFSFAYTHPTLTAKTIGKTDISYGVYIYHALVLHFFYEMGWRSWWSLIPLFITCFTIAWLSWTYIEKKALKLKKKSLYKNQ